MPLALKCLQDIHSILKIKVIVSFIQKDLTTNMLTTQDKHNLGCQKVARLEGQSSTGYDWERAVS